MLSNLSEFEEVGVLSSGWCRFRTCLGPEPAFVDVGEHRLNGFPKSLELTFEI